MSAIPLSETAAKRRIGDILLAQGFVTIEELADATLEQERTQQPLGQILVGRGAITRLELASALAEQWSDPAASITSMARSAPAPVSVPSAQDEAQYAARLQEAVADLARKVQSNKPLEGIDERVEELSRRIESTLARTQHIEAAVATLAESLEGVTTGVGEAFYALQTGTADLVSDLARIEQTVGEIAAREVPPADGHALADLEELRAAVAHLNTGTAGTTELQEQVDDLAQKLEVVRGELADVAVSARPDETSSERVDERLEELAAEVTSLRAELASLSHRDAHEGEADRLNELESRVESLSQERMDAGVLATRLEELEHARTEEMDIVNVLAVAMDRIRHDLTTAPPPPEAESSEVLEAFAALAQRIAALEEAPVAAPAPAHDDSELVSEVERFRLVLERVGLHLDEHDRALADLAPGRDVEERLHEITVLVQNLAEAESEHAAPPSAPRSAGAGDVGALLQRVEAAEAASQTDSEKLMSRLERMASSIDSRLQQLESDDTESR